MKKSIFVILALMVAFGGYTQKKPKINKANQARENGELAEAKEIIDMAIVHEKTKDDGKTWYYRGLIYATIDTTSNSEYSSLSSNALEEAMKAFDKADEMAEKDKEYFLYTESGTLITKPQQMDTYYSYYFNTAVEDFQSEKFQSAVDNFNNAAMVVKGDTNSYKNAAYAAHNGELFEAAKTAYRKAIDNGAKSKDMFTNLLVIISTIDKDNEKALEIAKEARKLYPTDPAIAKTEINLLIQMDKVEEAKDNLITAIEEEPDNTSLIFTLAAMYEELGQEDKAMETYSQALEVDPNHFESNFNKGVILLNRANEVSKEYTNLGISKADQKRGKELKPVMKAKYKEALPQWQKLYEIKPKDRQVVETLAYINQRLENYDRADELQEVLDSLPEASE